MVPLDGKKENTEKNNMDTNIFSLGGRKKWEREGIFFT